MSQQNQGENVLRESPTLFQGLVDNSTAVVYVKDLHGRYLLVNRRFEDLFHVTREAVVGKTDFDLFPRERAEAFRAFDRQVLAAGVALESEEVAPHDDGPHTYISIKCPLRDREGHAFAVCGISTDITERKRAEDRLREVNEMLRATVAASPLALIALDAHGRVVLWSPAAERTFGWPESEVLGRLNPTLPPERVLAGQTNFSPVIEGAPSTRETVRQRKDGRRVHVRISSAPLRNPAGNTIGTMEVVEDITERKAAEERMRASLQEKESLLKEVHHRVKNNLQIISSLLSLQASSVKDPGVLELFTESQNRVRAMALVHESLYRSGDLARIDLGPHVESICAHLYRSYGVDAGRIELQTEIGDVALDLDHAIPCGLIINELVSNALKHAFPGGRRGRILVALVVEAGGKYTLVVQDSGVGLPAKVDVSATDSLGLQLVWGLTQQLRGRVVVGREEGTRFAVTFNTR
jgi:PAS domain S-box-containing protein